MTPLYGKHSKDLAGLQAEVDAIAAEAGQLGRSSGITNIEAASETVKAQSKLSDVGRTLNYTFVRIHELLEGFRATQLQYQLPPTAEIMDLLGLLVELHELCVKRELMERLLKLVAKRVFTPAQFVRTSRAVFGRRIRSGKKKQ